MRIVVERHVAAPRETVFAIMTDVARWPQVISAIETIELVSPAQSGPATVGTSFRETRIMFGQKATEEMTVAEIAAPDRFVLTAKNHGMLYRAEHVLISDGEGTLLRLTFEATSETLLARLMSPLGWLMAGQLRRQLAADLDDMARAAESPAPD